MRAPVSQRTEVEFPKVICRLDGSDDVTLREEGAVASVLESRDFTKLQAKLATS